MNPNREKMVRLLFAATIFVSAFLLFQVQPIISKSILPWFGGSPAVWSTCMLFFQITLLAGYAYAHLLATKAESTWPVLLHMFLLAVAFLSLPIIPSEGWKPAGDADPTLQILLLLGATVGLPYFLLSSTGPLLQAWYFGWSQGKSPYRFYALSNLGSLGALLTYPFAVEVIWPTSTQAWIWSAGFALFALGCGLTGISFRSVVRNQGMPAKETEAPGAALYRPRSVEVQAAWLLLPMLASVMLLAITNHICQDIAVVPFLWVLPLSLYLLSFIICFDRPALYRPVLFSSALFLSVMVISVIMLNDSFNDKLDWVYEQVGWFQDGDSEVPIYMQVPDYLDSVTLEITTYSVALFLICMVCHGEVVRRRPPASQLTRFYLTISAGGALGGVFVALICPLVFDSHVEIVLGMVLVSILAVMVIVQESRRHWGTSSGWTYLATASVGLILIPVIVMGQSADSYEDVVDAKRNFYGALHVVERDSGTYDHRLALYNGRILHGMQMLSDDQYATPTLYYNEESGIGVTLLNHPKRGQLRVGAVGLGAGTLAAYGQADDYYTFYEINPQVVQLNKDWFSFLDDSAAKIDLVMGDARLSMQKQPPQQFDVLALDAFTGDAIPAHLLTKEAFSTYLRHMAPGGVIAVHISNRHLDLQPVVLAVAREYHLQMLLVDSPDNGGWADSSATWLLLTTNEEFINDPMVMLYSEQVHGLERPPVLWTDDYSNLWDLLE